MSKLLQKVFAKSIKQHVADWDLDIHFQSAYKSFYSTETVLLFVQNNNYLTVEEDKDTVLILFDLFATFDTIDNILQSRLMDWVMGH